MGASEPITRNRVADRQREETERNRNHYGVQHPMLAAMLAETAGAFLRGTTLR
jgi:hypothetical protein